MRMFFKSKPPQVFFVRGYAKSGTNWLCNLMNLHPEIECTGEFHLMPLFEGLRKIQNARWGILNNQHVSDGSEVLEAHFYQWVKNLVVEVCGKASFCGDRTPCPIRSTFVPGIKHLYITRDGRDAMVSWAYHALNQHLIEYPEMQRLSQLFDADPSYFEQHKHELLCVESMVRAFGADWNATVLDDFEMMNSADRGDVALDYYWVRYEDLQNDTLGLRDAIYEFLGLAASKARPLTSMTAAGFGDSNINRPQNFYRRGRAGTWQEYFTAGQLAWFEEEAREALDLVGAA